MMPTKYLDPRSLRSKPGKAPAAEIRHIAAPLKGLNLAAQVKVADPLSAGILDNWVITEDMIWARPGAKIVRDAGGDPVQVPAPIENLIPFYGASQDLALATATTLYKTDASVLYGGFASGNWMWTAFANLGQQKYTIMVNGADGVWSWDGGDSVQGAPVAVTAVSKAADAVITVGAANIGLFAVGGHAVISNAADTWTVINGTHIILSVNVAAGAFTIPIDTVACIDPLTTGVTAAVAGSVIHEAVLPPPGDPWVDVAEFDTVLVHMNRLWFADTANTAVYYLPLMQKSGELAVLPLNAYFRRGGGIRALATWTVEGGTGLDDQLVIFSTNGECAIFGGIDPATDMSLRGVYRFDAPVNKHCTLNWGGELWVLSRTGMLPMSTLIQAEDEQLGKYDRNVLSAFNEASRRFGDRQGWQLAIDHGSGRVVCNMPSVSSSNSDMTKRFYRQLVRHMPSPEWVTWSGLRSRSWVWLDGHVYFGDDAGYLWTQRPEYFDDEGQPIVVDLLTAWSLYGTPAGKQFKMVLPYLSSTMLSPRPFVDIKVNYDLSPPRNQPDAVVLAEGAKWDETAWNTTPWAVSPRQINNWQGVAGHGRVGAVRLTAQVIGGNFGLHGFDLLFERGSGIG